MLDNIIQTASILVSVLPFIYVVYFFLTPKFRSAFGAGLMLTVITVILIAKIAFENKYGMHVSISLFFYFLYFMVMYCFSKDSWKTVLKFFLAIFATINLIEVLEVTLLTATGYFDNPKNQLGPLVQFIASATSSIFMIVVAHIWKRSHKIGSYTKYSSFVTILISQILIWNVVFFYFIYNADSPARLQAVIICMGITWIFMDIIFVKAIVDNYHKAQLEFSLDRAMEMEKVQYEYYESLTDSITSLRKYRHDLNNILQTLTIIINDPETLENGKELLEQLRKRYDKIQLPFYCSNPVINAVLLAKTAAAQEKGIEVAISINLENTNMFEHIDLCSIFSNMLDNAIEAACEVEHGHIAISSWTETEHLFIKCVNSYSGKIRKDSKKLISTKGKDRGLGISIIESIAERYSGKFLCECGEEFSALAVLDMEFASQKCHNECVTTQENTAVRSSHTF